MLADYNQSMAKKFSMIKCAKKVFTHINYLETMAKQTKSHSYFVNRFALIQNVGLKTEFSSYSEVLFGYIYYLKKLFIFVQ